MACISRLFVPKSRSGVSASAPILEASVEWESAIVPAASLSASHGTEKILDPHQIPHVRSLAVLLYIPNMHTALPAVVVPVVFLATTTIVRPALAQLTRSQSATEVLSLLICRTRSLRTSTAWLGGTCACVMVSFCLATGGWRLETNDDVGIVRPLLIASPVATSYRGDDGKRMSSADPQPNETSHPAEDYGIAYDQQLSQI
ncbi:hypothetical protein KC330_g150 [Hortaea werneckii]|nr:hypothetical protein KC330_g150 [Hortaea werneckii]